MPTAFNKTTFAFFADVSHTVTFWYFYLALNVSKTYGRRHLYCFLSKKSRMPSLLFAHLIFIKDTSYLGQGSQILELIIRNGGKWI